MLARGRTPVTVLFAFPVFAGGCRGVYRCIRDLLRFSRAEIKATVQVSLQLLDGRTALTTDLPATGLSSAVLFFDTSRNLIEGTVVTRRSSGPAVRESAVSLRPGWKRFARGQDNDPIELMEEWVNDGGATVQFDLQFHNRNPFIANHAKSENALIVLMRES
jgi:hypothetical protein